MNMGQLSAPLFAFGENSLVPEPGVIKDGKLTGVSFALTGPGATAEAGHLPVRGDLAHIALAGRYFVPHYAVPMPMRVADGGATLLAANREDSGVLATLAAGDTFDVLEIAGPWAWGQHGADGFVGYVAVDRLERIEA